MCGRFAVDKKPEEIALETEALWEDTPTGFPSWNTCPTSLSPVLSQSKLYSWSWGLIPRWSKSDASRSGMINARVETLDEKPAFRDLVEQQQCIIPVNGYFEWQRKGQSKIPYYFYSGSDSMLLMAGLWDKWISPTGKEIYSFTVVTKEASESIAHIHHRMPIILNLKEAQEWAENQMSPKEASEVGLKILKFHEVSTKVNSVRNNSSDLIQATDSPQLWQDELF